MIKYYRSRAQVPAPPAIYVQEPRYWRVDDGVSEAVMTAGAIPDSVMSLLEEISEQDAIKQLSTNYRRSTKGAVRLARKRMWRAVVVYALGWVVGVVCLSGILWRPDRWFHSDQASLFVVFLVVAAFVLGFGAAGVGMALTWASSAWNQLRPRQLALKLLRCGIGCGIAIGVTAFLALLPPIVRTFGGM